MGEWIEIYLKFNTIDEIQGSPSIWGSGLKFDVKKMSEDDGCLPLYGGVD